MLGLGHAGDTLGFYWDYIGVMLGSFWGYIGVIVWLYWDNGKWKLLLRV